MPLPQYGKFDMGTGYAADHPLELLFINGGAKELCEEQIRQQGLYMSPPLIPLCKQPLTQYHRRHAPSCWAGATPVVFPQLAGMTGLGPFECRFCGVAKATVEARDQHEGVMHKEEKSDIRTGETLADGLIKGLKPEAPAIDAGIDALLKRINALEAQLAAPKPLETCGCGATYKVGGATFHRLKNAKHLKWAKKNEVGVAV